MSKIAIIATSTSCLDYLDLNHENLRVLRMKINMKDESYEDFIDMTAEEFYRRLREDTSLVPSSSMPSPGEYLDFLTELEGLGYDTVLTITISSELSGTYNVIKSAESMYEGKMKLHTLDSRNGALAEGYLSLEALRLVKEGKELDEIVKFLEKLRINRKQYFMVDNLRLFVANGRLSGAAGFLGSMLKMKPILEVNNDGKIVPFKKIRTQKKALAEMVEIVKGDLEGVKKFIVAYDTSDNQAGIDYVKNEMEKAYPGYKYIEAPITPVVGCHTGNGTVGIAFFNLD
ncbi:DegV family protein [Candidatus Izimaplasma bacterium]|nr:DegV family protein [Candidatus Izimaplasma bacterium]